MKVKKKKTRQIWQKVLEKGQNTEGGKKSETAPKKKIREAIRRKTRSLIDKKVKILRGIKRDKTQLDSPIRRIKKRKNKKINRRTKHLRKLTPQSPRTKGSTGGEYS